MNRADIHVKNDRGEMLPVRAVAEAPLVPMLYVVFQSMRERAHARVVRTPTGAAPPTAPTSAPAPAE